MHSHLMPESSVKEIHMYLKHNFPGCDIMPTRSGPDPKQNGKIPKYAHKNGAWDTDKAEKALPECDEGAVILLDDSLIVVDVDEVEWVDKIERDFPEFQQTIQTQTKKGKHYYFTRTDRCTNIYDGARLLFDSNNKSIPIDLKTQTRKGTRGVISIPPSPNKKWIIALGVQDPAPLPDGFVEFINKSRGINAQLCEVHARTPSIVSEVGSFPFSSISQYTHNSHNTQYTYNTETTYKNTKQACIVESLISLLSEDRASDRNKWMEVGWCLHNIAHTHLQTWIEFSRKSKKYEQGVCEREWFDMNDTGFKLDHLRKWAKADNPLQYKIFRDHTIVYIVQEHLVKGAQGLAQIASYFLADTRKIVGGKTYVYDEIKNIWFFYPQGQWDQKRVSVCLQTELTNMLHISKFKLVDEQEEGKDAAIISGLEEMIKQIQKQIKSAQGNINILKCYMDNDHLDKQFEEKLDTNTELLCVNNGVIDLKLNILRNRNAKDMLHKMVEIDYDTSVDTSMCSDFIREIMAGDEDMVIYFQKMLGYFITGEVNEQLFFIFNGDGRNGKGVLINILEAILGGSAEMMKSPPNEVITVNTERCRTNTECQIAEFDKTRLLVWQELEGNEKLRIAEVQKLTGEDKVECRSIYGKPKWLKPTWKCVLCTNNMPDLRGEVMTSMKERVRVINFPVKFLANIENEPPSPLIKKANPNVLKYHRKHIQNWLKWIVEGAYMYYNSEAGHQADLRSMMPDAIKKATNNYMQNEDALSMFINEKCCVGDDHEIPCADFLEEYIEYSCKKDYSRRTLKMAMEKRKCTSKVVSIYGKSTRCFTGIGWLPA